MTYEEARAEMLARCANGDFIQLNYDYYGRGLLRVDLWTNTVDIGVRGLFKNATEYKLADITLEQFRSLVSGNV